MASVNKVILVGNLGADPETRYMPSGDATCNIRLATTDRWKDRQTGETREQTEWHRVTFWGRLAEIADQYLRKGSPCYIEGKLQTRKWQDKETGQDRYTTEIRADALQLLGRAPEGNRGDNNAPARQQSQPQKQQANDDFGFGNSDLDDDIPF